MLNFSVYLCELNAALRSALLGKFKVMMVRLVFSSVLLFNSLSVNRIHFLIFWLGTLFNCLPLFRFSLPLRRAVLLFNNIPY